MCASLGAFFCVCFYFDVLLMQSFLAAVLHVNKGTQGTFNDEM